MVVLGIRHFSWCWALVDMPGRRRHLSSIRLVMWRRLVVVVVGMCSGGSGHRTTVGEGGGG